MTTNMTMNTASDFKINTQLLLIGDTISTASAQYLSFATLYHDYVDKNGDDLLSFGKKLIPRLDETINIIDNLLIKYNEDVLTKHLNKMKNIAEALKHIFEKGLY